jgi:hypothetical protein
MRAARAAALAIPFLSFSLAAGAGELGRAIAGHAEALVGLRSVAAVARDVPDDCTGLVRLVYGKSGIDLRDLPAQPGDNGVTSLFRAAHGAHAFHRRAPRAGDIVFFHETYDRNRDGKRNDGLTHVGVVDSVKPDGSVTFVHRMRSGIARSRLSLRHPGRRAANDVLRRGTSSSRAYLAGELVSGFASPEPLLLHRTAVRARRAMPLPRHRPG